MTLTSDIVPLTQEEAVIYLVAGEGRVPDSAPAQAAMWSAVCEVVQGKDYWHTAELDALIATAAEQE